MLGASFSTAPLGVIQMMVGGRDGAWRNGGTWLLTTAQMSASLLSHYQEQFPLVAAWLLFFVGIINFLLGIALRSQLKLRRSLFRSKRDVLEKGDIEGQRSNKNAKHALWTLSNTCFDSKREAGAAQRESESLLPAKPIRRPLDAFTHPTEQGGQVEMASVAGRGTAMLSTTSEMLRKRARQENWRFEQEQEEQDKEQGALTRLDDEFQWDTTRNVPVPRADSQRTLSRAQSRTQARIERGQAGVSRDLGASTVREPGIRAAFQRRSLVLSRMVQQVKRGSSGGRRKKRASRVPAVPLRYPPAKLTPRPAPSAWIEVNKSAPPPGPPSAAYRPNRSTVYEDVGNDGTRTLYHSYTPIADQFAYHAR